MAVSRGALDDALGKYAGFLRGRDAVADRFAARYSTLLNDYAQALVRVAAANTFPAGAAIRSDEQLRALISQLEGELESLLTQAGKQIHADIIESTAAETKAVRESYAALGRSTADRLQAAAANFEQRQAQSIGSSAFRGWLQRFERDGQALISGMEREFVNSQILDQGQRALANRLAQLPEFQFKNLPALSESGKNLFTAGGKLGDSEALQRRALLIARTENTAISNRMHTAWTTEAGFSYYVNVNPLDERTTDGCLEASRQPAMTLEQWAAWTASDGQGGIPPRLPNCRSDLFAVPDELKNETGERSDAPALEESAKA